METLKLCGTRHSPWKWQNATSQQVLPRRSSIARPEIRQIARTFRHLGSGGVENRQ